MTIREMYNWAKEHDCLDVIVVKHMNAELFDIRDIVHLKEVLNISNENDDKVILD